MANGFPIGGLAGARDLMEHFNGRTGDVLLAGTFNGNPAACAAAIATIDHLRADPGFYERTHSLGERMRTGLRGIIDELSLSATVVGFGGVFAMYFMDGPARGYRDLLRNDDNAYVAFHRGMTERGHFMLPMALKRNHISGSHTQAEVDATLEVSRDVLRHLRRTGTIR
jgi:glutamate-1-semialdehyde 2,1-aminomutase